MTDHQFKNGITVHIPDDMPAENQLEEWTTVKMSMSLILFPPETEPAKVRKPYTITKEGLRKRRKFWRDQKKK